MGHIQAAVSPGRVQTLPLPPGERGAGLGRSSRESPAPEGLTGRGLHKARAVVKLTSSAKCKMYISTRAWRLQVDNQVTEINVPAPAHPEAS